MLEAIYHVYNNMWAAANGKVLVCRCWCVVVGKIFVVNYFRVKYFRTFSVYENIFTTKNSELHYYFSVCKS